MRELDDLVSLSPGATFRKADLHVHTPASADWDAKQVNVSPEDIVNAALAAGLDIIAVTDHNTAGWCDRIQSAAQGTKLHVFPGVEISTPQGHLLAIFDAEKPSPDIEGLLMNAGLSRGKIGSLDTDTDRNMWDVAEMIDGVGGVAIAAHVDSERGFMKMGITGPNKKKVHACRRIRGFETSDPQRQELYLSGKISGYPRRVACIQSSDSLAKHSSRHQLEGIGSRYCYVKMDALSVEGIKQALLDPRMRICFPDNPIQQPDNVIEGMWVTGGFLQGEIFRFSDDFSCLIGGTGVGKSLTLELLRFALDQRADIKSIAEETESLLKFGLGKGGKVNVLLRRNDDRYVVEREYTQPQEASTVFRVVEDGKMERISDIEVSMFFPIKAFSQSEIIEFARVPGARLTLIDDLIDISEERSAILGVKADLKTNATQIVEARREIADAGERLRELANVRTDIARFQTFFQHDEVKRHDLWRREEGVLDKASATLSDTLTAVQDKYPGLSAPLVADDVSPDSPNQETLDRVRQIEVHVRESLSKSAGAAERAIVKAQGDLAKLRQGWNALYEKAEAKYEQLLTTLDQGSLNLKKLDGRLKQGKKREQELLDLRKRVANVLEPGLVKLCDEREFLLSELQKLRGIIRDKRSAKADTLTDALGKLVHVVVNHAAESDEFNNQLQDIKVGSFIEDEDIKVMAKTLHPIPFVKSLWAEDYEILARTSKLEKRLFERLRKVVVDEDRLTNLYELQLTDVEDRIDVRLEVAKGTYKNLESLAHGQKCTVILMVALAEGTFPLLADQPEDALHAKFIESYIVETLRQRRGIRQYIFSTRNANVLVSGDAEQVLALDSDAQRGWIERQGSIDRFETRDLILLNLEGGKDAFTRRSQKYGIAPP